MRPLNNQQTDEIKSALSNMKEILGDETNWGRIPKPDGRDTETFLALRHIEGMDYFFDGNLLKESPNYDGIKFSLIGAIVVSCPNYELFDVIYDILCEQIWEKCFAAHNSHFHPELMSFNNCLQTTHIEILHIIEQAEKCL